MNTQEEVNLHIAESYSEKTLKDAEKQEKEKVSGYSVQNSVRKETQTARVESSFVLKSWKPDLT